MVPFITIQLNNDDGLILINCPYPKLFGLKFIQSVNDVVLERPIDLMGGLFDVNAVLQVDENVNVFGIAVVPVDDKSREIIKTDSNKFQYMAGEKARLAFKAFIEEKPDAFEQLKKVVECDI